MEFDVEKLNCFQRIVQILFITDLTFLLIDRSLSWCCPREYKAPEGMKKSLTERKYIYILVGLRWFSTPTGDCRYTED